MSSSEIVNGNEGNNQIIIELETIDVPITYRPNYFIYNNNLDFKYYHFFFDERKRK